jgi:hypothetical protein
MFPCERPSGRSAFRPDPPRNIECPKIDLKHSRRQASAEIEMGRRQILPPAHFSQSPNLASNICKPILGRSAFN